MQTVYFDAKLRTRKGFIPYWDEVRVDSAYDGQLVWFHERYGRMYLYRLHQVDDRNFIAEDTGARCSTDREEWEAWHANPALALC